MRLGAQLSAMPGFEAVVEEAGLAGLRALQLFSRNPVGGKGQLIPPLPRMKALLIRYAIHPLYIHAPYFVNPAALEKAKHLNAKTVLVAEMRRAKQLGGDYLVLHPGHFPKPEQKDQAWDQTYETLIAMLSAPGKILLENTAGQGKELGADLADIGHLFHRLGRTHRVGLMWDTAHWMAAGHPLATQADVDKGLEAIDQTVGLARLKGIHLNDGEGAVGSRRDRHAPLLTGPLGREALKALLRWAEMLDIGVILETPGRDISSRQADLTLVRNLMAEF